MEPWRELERKRRDVNEASAAIPEGMVPVSKLDARSRKFRAFK